MINRKPIRSKLKQILYSEKLAPYWLIAPFGIAFLLFYAWPIVWAPWMSVHSYSFTETEFVGITNYIHLMESGSFIRSIKVTIIMGLIRFPFTIGISLLAAIAVNSVIIQKKSIWRTLYIVPIVVSPVVTAIVFRLLLEPGAIIDQITLSLYGTNIAWLNETLPAQFSVAMSNAYIFISVYFIFFLAGLVAVDQELYRAAKVDGANKIQQFRHVTIPQLRPIIVLVVLLETSSALKVFAVPMVLTDGGGPAGATRTVVLQLYNEAFVNINFGIAAAMGVILTTLIAVLMIVEYLMGQRND